MIISLFHAERIKFSTHFFFSLVLSDPFIRLVERLFKHFFSQTTEQLNEIRRIKLSRIVCDNSDKLEAAQVYVMVLPDPDM